MKNKILLKLSIAIIAGLAYTVSFGMQLASQQTHQQRTRLQANPQNRRVTSNAFALERKLTQLNKKLENTDSPKLLEHPCFKGESLKFQNTFFAANYTSLPARWFALRRLIEGSDNIPTNLLNEIFDYHAYYRKSCITMLYDMRDDSLKKSELYTRTLIRLSKDPMLNFERFRQLCITEQIDLDERQDVLADMRRAILGNDYPMASLIYKEYKSGPQQ